MTSMLPQRHPESDSGLWRRIFHGFHKIRQRANWVDYAGQDWIERIMAEQVTDGFHAKQGRSIARWTLTNNTGATLVVYLKRHYVLPRWAGLLALLFPGRSYSPGLQEWDNLHKARAFGLPVPEPIAAGEMIATWGRMSSFLAVAELTDMLPLHQAIPLAQKQLTATAFRQWKHALVQELARLIHLMHDRHAYHKDLYLCHFYIRTGDTQTLVKDWHQRVTVIDLHRFGQHRLSSAWWWVKDLAQLLYSSEQEGVTLRDRLAFWKAYAGPGRSRSMLARLIRWKWRLYRRHNAKQKRKGR